MKKVFILVVVLYVCFACKAQTAEDSVKAVINRMFVAMKKADSSGLRECFTDSAVLQTFSRDRLTITTETPANFVRQVGSMPKDSADEKITFETIKIDGPLASVWTPYSFYWNNRFSHCGANSFQLVRMKGAWKIQYLIDTRRRQGCPQ